MGYQERDYYRGADAGSSYTSSVAVKLIVLNCIVFLANLFFGGPNNTLTAALTLRPDTLAEPWRWYQFLTYGFAHSPEGLWHLAGNMLGLYFFGKPLEDRFGWKEFLRFYLLAIVLGGLVWAVRSWSLNSYLVANFGGGPKFGGLLGASGGTVAAIILFCLLYPRATLLLMFVIPTPAWVAGLIIVLLDMFSSRDLVAHDVHLTGALFALTYWYFGWNFSRLPGMTGISTMFKSLGKAMKAKPDLRVHDPEAYYEDLDAEADKLLEKMARDGAESLSKRERRVLEAYSRRMRQKHR
ncbi:MAG: rhomboid family intramembrane serine protease [Pirellulaceae bacterium]